MWNFHIFFSLLIFFRKRAEFDMHSLVVVFRCDGENFSQRIGRGTVFPDQTSRILFGTEDHIDEIFFRIAFQLLDDDFLRVIQNSVDKLVNDGDIVHDSGLLLLAGGEFGDNSVLGQNGSDGIGRLRAFVQPGHNLFFV